jgi:hypothetical protein
LLYHKYIIFHKKHKNSLRRKEYDKKYSVFFTFSVQNFKNKKRSKALQSQKLQFPKKNK